MAGLKDSCGNQAVTTVSFSGVDGAGKSTQIEHLVARLNERGQRVRVFRFWDDVARLTAIREGTGHTIFRGDKGIGSPEAPINRRDKNVRGWPMTCLRLFLYLLDVIHLRKVFKAAMRENAGLIIFDRYIYDELANLELNRGIVRAYVRFILQLAPRPAVSFLLDADPEAARARKPEYPLSFICSNRQAYLTLSRMIGGFTIIAPMSIDAAKSEVWRSTEHAIQLNDDRQKSENRRSLRESTRAGEAIS